MNDTICAPQSFADVVNLWKSAEELADAIGEPGVNVRAWRNRDRIPPDHWPSVIAAARKIGRNLTAEQLIKLAVKRAGRAA